MKSCEERMTKSKVDLKKYINENRDSDLRKILEWVDSQVIANKDSLHWWMTGVAGKNSLGNRFFEDLIQLSALKSWLLEGEKKDQILVVCDDYYLALTIYENFSSLCIIDLYKFQVWQFKSWVSNARGIFIRCVAEFLKSSIRMYVAMITRPRVLQQPEGDIYLIHQCLDEKSFQSNKTLLDRYFGVLPLWLESRVKNVYRLPWIFGTRNNLIKKYRKLREYSCFIPEDWISLSNFFEAITDVVRTIFAIRLDVPYRDLNIRYLLVRERLNQLGQNLSSIEFWLYKYALPKWGIKLTSLSYISPFEMLPAEMVCAYTWRKSFNKTGNFAGYYHSLVSRDYLSYHVTKEQVNSLVFPDKIVVNGSLAKSVLLRQGLPLSKIANGPALRQVFGLNEVNPVNKDSLVILLSLSLDHSAALLSSLAKISAWIDLALNVPVIVKPHPMLPIENVLKVLKWKRLPSSWQLHHGEMTDVLKKSRCCVNVASASIFDVLLSGCIALPFQYPLGLSWNYADIIEENFELLRAVDEGGLQTKLEEIFLTKRNLYDEQFKKISEKICKSLSVINDDNLKVFLNMSM